MGVTTGQVNYTRINPQLFTNTLGAIGGGDITIQSGGVIAGLSASSGGGYLTSSVAGGTSERKAFSIFGEGKIAITALSDVKDTEVSVLSGTIDVESRRDVRLSKLALYDAAVSIAAARNLTSAVPQALGNEYIRLLNGGRQSTVASDTGPAFYGDYASLAVFANSSITQSVTSDREIADATRRNFLTAPFPGSYTAIAQIGDITLGALPKIGELPSVSVLVPNVKNNLTLFAGSSISLFSSLVVEDSDPGNVPGLLGNFNETPGDGIVVSGRLLGFPNYSTFDELSKRLAHSAELRVTRDNTPIRFYAGTDVTGLIASVPKRAFIDAGRDIVNAVFFGQNLMANDITLVRAGRDITATSRVAPGGSTLGGLRPPLLPTLLGNTFQLGGVGDFILQAGRDAGPFLNSASASDVSGPRNNIRTPVGTFAGGVISVGNENNPYLSNKGASITTRFGVGKGIAWDAFRDVYLAPEGIQKLDDAFFPAAGKDASRKSSVDRTKFVYSNTLIGFVRDKTGAADLTYDEAYALFVKLPPLTQQLLLQSVYFQELIAVADVAGPSYLKYARGYSAVNQLFPAALGYTKNALDGGPAGASTLVSTGDLDLRLSTIQTRRGGDISIFGPGGRVFAGSLVATDQQISRRGYVGNRLYQGLPGFVASFSAAKTNIVTEIPAGLEGILTLDGGNLYSFADGDFLLNQSRAFVRQTGDIAVWSSNADVNAGQGRKSSANFPPIAIRCNSLGFCEQDRLASTTGAGIATFTPDTPGAKPGDVYLIAPRGAVDADDADVRVAGNLAVTAQFVLNADNFDVKGKSGGIPTLPATDTGALTNAGNTAAAATKDAGPPKNANTRGSIIIVEIIGFGGSDGSAPSAECPGSSSKVDGKCVEDAAKKTSYNAHTFIKVIGVGALSEEQQRFLTEDEQRNLAQ